MNHLRTTDRSIPRFRDLKSDDLQVKECVLPLMSHRKVDVALISYACPDVAEAIATSDTGKNNSFILALLNLEPENTSRGYD